MMQCSKYSIWGKGLTRCHFLFQIMIKTEPSEGSFQEEPTDETTEMEANQQSYEEQLLQAAIQVTYQELSSDKEHTESSDREHTHSSKSYACHICGKQLLTPSGFRRHLLAHNEENKLKCQFCEKSFAENQFLQQHVDFDHQNIKNFQCEICSKFFAYKSSWKRHQNVCYMKAEKVRPVFECEICQVQFTKKDTLHDHMKGKHLGGDGYVCQYCGEKFKWRGSRANHINQVHKDK